MTEDPESRARRLIGKVRAKAFLNAALTALLRGVALGALLAAAAACVALLAGGAPRPWLLLAAVPAAGLAAVGLARARPTRRTAALLLDRQAGTRERFLAALEAQDKEIRALAARQALSSDPAPVRFPPTAAGLAAALSLALLGAVLLLGGGDGSGVEPDEPAVGPAAALPTGVGAPANPDGAASSRTSPSPADRALARVAAGEDPGDAEWEALERAGLSAKTREEVREALAAGNLTAAVEALRSGLGGGGSSADPGADPAARNARWREYEAALESPSWSPRFDRVVRAYLERSRK